MKPVQTDNSYLFTKIKLRLDNLPDKKKIRVLDCYCGNRKIWNYIKHIRPNIEFEVVGIDVKKDRDGIYLVGDNVKFIKAMDLSRFDIIDLDAYGVPFHQLEAIFKNPKAAGKTVFVTFIQTLYGCLHRGLLDAIGFKKSMVEKIPAIFNKNGIEKLCTYLQIRGVKKVQLYSDASRKKNYLSFIV
jgi:hypothetical protein